MHPLVEKYLNEKAQTEQKRKNDLLIELGLCEKRYTKRYCKGCKTEWDSVAGTNRYYFPIPIEVSDEEYAKILKYQQDSAKPATNPQNAVANILVVTTVVTILFAFFFGIVRGRDLYGDFHLILALPYWAGGFLSGMLIFGFSEIIRLLNDLKYK